MSRNTFSTTKVFDANLTRIQGEESVAACGAELAQSYQSVIEKQQVDWEERLEFARPLGRGGQGVVFLTHRRGPDDFVLPVALKLYSPERYSDAQYEEAMAYVAYIAARVARIQHDNLLDVHNWRSVGRIRVMEMEWIDGFDLTLLLRNEMLEHLRQQETAAEFKRTNDVVITAGPNLPRLKPGVAIPIIRDCLGALAALHREGIVHSDIKPANIMIKRTGNAKLVDMGSAFDIHRRPSRYVFTPAYASLEALEGRDITYDSDITSLGYVLIEMLSGRRLFDRHNATEDPIQARYTLHQRLHTLLPRPIASSDLLMRFCTRLINPDSEQRFENAEAANIGSGGAGELVRQLIKGDLACESESELRNLLDKFAEYPIDTLDPSDYSSLSPLSSQQENPVRIASAPSSKGKSR